ARPCSPGGYGRFSKYLTDFGVSGSPRARERRAWRRARVTLVTRYTSCSRVVNPVLQPRIQRPTLPQALRPVHARPAWSHGKVLWGRSRAAAVAEYPAQRLDPPGGALLVAMGGGAVVVHAHQVVGRVLLGDHSVRPVVRVAVLDAVAELLGTGVVGVAQMGRDPLPLPCAHVRDRGIQGLVGGVGLGGGGDVHDGLGERDPPFGHAQHLHGLHRGDRDLQRGGVGHAHLLAGRDHHPAGDEAGVLPRLYHARQVVQRGVDVAAAHRLDERAGDVVVLVAGAVVAHRGAVDGLREGGGIDLRGVLHQRGGRGGL